MRKVRLLYSSLLCFTLLFFCKTVQVNASLCDFNLELKGSYLYWGVQEDQLGFAITDFPLNPSSMSSSPPEKVKTHDPKWGSGLRVEADLFNTSLPVNCRFQWTHLQTRSHAFAQGPGMPNLFVTTIAGFLGDSPFFFSDTAGSKWKIKVDEYAFDIEYLFCGDSCISFHPYLGIFAARINQNQDVTYTGVNAKEFTDATLSVFRKNHFCGIGPRFGLGLNWEFCNGFSLVSDANAAYLFGRFDTVSSFAVPQGFASFFPDINANRHLGRPMINGSIGLEWNKQICQSVALTIAIGYEFQYWWQQWHSASNGFNLLVTGEGQWGDLSMHGLVVSAGIVF